MSLPLLPGNNFSKTLGQTKFHKSQHFEYQNEVPMMVGEYKPGIGGTPLSGQKRPPRTSFFPPGDGPHQPSWLAFDKQVLSFDAFFQEAVHERRNEQYRVRPVKIYFYLEDDSIQVIEPRIKDIGIPQGTIIKRHRIPRPPPCEDEFYTVDDLNVGKDITLYGRTFKLTNCDSFTLNFLKKLGIQVDIPHSIPEDPYTENRKKLSQCMQPLRPYERHDTLKQFLEHDRDVLRFFCFWDDSDSMFGDPRELILHYFLSDDTIELREVLPPNAGRDTNSIFLRRGKLPKSAASLPLPGKITDRTVLNVFGPMGHGGRHILDSLKTGTEAIPFYKDEDLAIGTLVNAWGRQILLCDCDEFTKNFYKSKFGLSDFTPIQYKQRQPVKSEPENPPYNGFGSEEDSLCSCKGLMPKPPRRDFIKFMKKDRKGLESHVLRFLAILETDVAIDRERRFIISYFLSDDTLLIFEPQVRNSGHSGGKFLERSKVVHPGAERFSTKPPRHYEARDLFVGAVLDINGSTFRLINADEYAFSYMEKESHEFPQSSLNAIYQKLRSSSACAELKSLLPQGDFRRSGTIPYDKFYCILRELLGDKISDHEIMTLARKFMHKVTDSGEEAQSLALQAQDALKKASFESFAELQELFCRHDLERTGYVDVDKVRQVVSAIKLPVSKEIMKALAQKVATPDGKVDYSILVCMLNWRSNAILDCYLPPPSDGTDCSKEPPKAEEVSEVDYVSFLGNACG